MTDPILFWNHVCNEAIRFDHSLAAGEQSSQGGPTRTSRAAAVVHLAMHDAHFGVSPASGISLYTGSSVPAYSGPVTPRHVSAAVSAAAHVTLSALYPKQLPLFAKAAQDIAAANETDGTAHAYGLAIARELLKRRKKDGSEAEAQEVYAYAQAKPHHRSDPLSPVAQPHEPTWGNVKTFSVTAFQHQAPFPSFKSPAYDSDHREVLQKGGAPTQSTTTRTKEESIVGLYWAYDGARLLGTPPRLYNQIVRVIADKHCNDVADNARLFALINVAMADAGIHAWFWKYRYDLWRPVIGIREYDANFGPDAVAGRAVDGLSDPFWRPFGAPRTNDVSPGAHSFTPNFPAYPSGHATFGAATFEMVRRFYNGKAGAPKFAEDEPDSIGFDFVSDELDGNAQDNDGGLRVRHERRFSSVAEAMYENSVSRIFLGVHWRFDGTSGKNVAQALAAKDQIGGLTLGRAIAKNIFESGMLPSPASVHPPV